MSREVSLHHFQNYDLRTRYFVCRGCSVSFLRLTVFTLKEVPNAKKALPDHCKKNELKSGKYVLL